MIGEVTIAGKRHAPRVYNTGDYRLTCPGVDLIRKTNAPATLRAIHFANSTFEEQLGTAGSRLETQFGRLQAFAFRSNLLDGVVERLHQTSRDRRQGDGLFIDSLVNTAILELWRLAGGGFESLSPDGKGLPSRMLRKIDRFIDDQAGAKITAAALAEVADMPSALFQSALRETTGQTPYQYVLARRIATARCLIETSSLSLAEVAFRTGFSSQSHMTDAFKAKLGVTPGGVRRARA